MTKKELIYGLKNGEHKAYKFLFSEYYEWLCNYVYKLSGNYSLSEDLVQEVFVKLWDNHKNITIESSLKNYLFKSCHNQFLLHLRKEKKKMTFLESLQQDVLYKIYDEDNDDSVLDHNFNKLQTIINQLPPKCKEVFIMAKLDQKKYKEIATDMGISIKTVEAQMSKALKFVREKSTMLD